ncbi:MAG TPA: S8 family serine peptidase [Mycobacteriales bacterium]|nr:S8 family serine peptidase [Mycobacteriales bacterium]
MPGLRKHAATAVGAALAAAALAGAVPASASAQRHPARVVVTTTDDTVAARVARELRAHGARHVRALPVVHGYSADVPGAYVDQLRRVPGVRSVTVDASVRLMGVNPDLGYDPQNDFGSLYDVSRVIQAQDVYANGYAGRGVDVALIDSGVAPVQGLTSGNVVNGPDLSFESQSPGLAHLDTFGHGTHMASIIAGRDVAQAATAYQGDTAHFNGVAPNSRVVSLKVADHSGATDVSQVIAAIDWVVAHKNDNGLNVRVLNLSFGTDATQSPQLDPLCFAVENAWRKGIVVVVSGGNDGTSGPLTNPAQDPYVIAVGAEDPNGSVNASDDLVPAFSSRGSAARRVDLVAPAVHVLGLRDPASAIDQAVPSARVGTRFFRGSGTSQAAAVVSGAVALLLQRYPTLTPDQVKQQLMATATPFNSATADARGRGVVNVKRAVNQSPVSLAAAQQTATPGTGTGTLEGSRGSFHVGDANGLLTGEQDIFGHAFDSASWATATSAGTAWDGGAWNGTAWTGNAWNSDDWTGNAWNGTAWTGNAWNGNAWNDSSWSGHGWTGNAWNGTGWTDSAWSGNAWNGNAWNGTGWTGTGWTGTGWTGTAWTGTAWLSSGWE